MQKEIEEIQSNRNISMFNVGMSTTPLSWFVRSHSWSLKYLSQGRSTYNFNLTLKRLGLHKNGQQLLLYVLRPSIFLKSDYLKKN